MRFALWRVGSRHPEATFETSNIDDAIDEAQLRIGDHGVPTVTYPRPGVTRLKYSELERYELVIED